MGIGLGALATMATQKALSELKDRLLNPAVSEIGTITAISYRDKKLFLNVVLNGLEDREIEVSCGRLRIADDGSRISLGAFQSNMPFAQNALNMFAARDYKIPDSTMVRAALVTTKKVLKL
jgi:hypothetical protein